MSGSSKSKLIYVLAASHSGSTLTTMLLSAHPDLCSVGELKANHLGDADSYLCSCRTKVKECTFWKGISQKMAEKGEQFDITNAGTDIRSGASPYVLRLLRPLVREPFVELIRDCLLMLSPTWRKQLPIIQRRNSLYIKSVLQQAGVDTIVDSSKIGIRLKYLLKNKDLDIKVVWVVRDGRGVSLAYKDPAQFADASDPKMRGGGTGRNVEPSRDISIGANEWLRCNEEAQAVLKQVDPSRWIRIRYEDVCNHTEQTLDRVYQFIGVDAAKKRLDFKAVEHHILGNGMRLDTNDKIVLDERWREQLTPENLKVFDSIAGEMNREFGYR